MMNTEKYLVINVFSEATKQIEAMVESTEIKETNSLLTPATTIRPFKLRGWLQRYSKQSRLQAKIFIEFFYSLTVNEIIAANNGMYLTYMIETGLQVNGHPTIEDRIISGKYIGLFAAYLAGTAKFLQLYAKKYDTAQRPAFYAKKITDVLVDSQIYFNLLIAMDIAGIFQPGELPDNFEEIGIFFAMLVGASSLACFQLRDFRKYLKERMSVRGWRIINSCFEVTNGVADFDGSWQNLLPLIGIYKANPDPQSAMFTRYVLMLSYGILNGIIEYNNPQFLEHWRDHQEEFLVAGAAFLADVMFQMTETTVEADLITNVLYLLLFMLTLSSTLVFTVKPTPQNRVEEVTDDPGTSVVIERDMTNVTGNPYMQRQFLQDLQPATTTEQDYSFN